MSDIMLRPPVNRAMKVLDRSFFKTHVATSAARIYKPQDISSTRTALLKSQDALQYKHSFVRKDPDEKLANKGGKCLVLDPRIKHDDQSTWSSTLQEMEKSGKLGVIPYTLTLDYDFWAYDDIIRAVLPEEDHGEIPGGYATIGHVAHLNLREQYLPYKQMIAEIIRDKASSNIKTVINKVEHLLGNENEFRTFEYEVLAGADDLDVETKHQECIFRFNFGKTYWNPRLHHEHERILAKFRPGEAICDVMAGVGPFSVPAGKQKVFAFANDLNPQSYRYLRDAIAINRIEKFVEPFNEDGHSFIRTSAIQLATNPKSVHIPGKQNRSNRQSPTKGTTYNRPLTFSHYTMNLPGNAFDFLPSFIGLYSKPLYTDRPPRDLPKLPKDPRHLFEPYTSAQLPWVHAYCFHVEGDVAPEVDICKRISEKLDYELTPDYPELEFTELRRVSRLKLNFCASFRLPPEVAFRGLDMP